MRSDSDGDSLGVGSDKTSSVDALQGRGRGCGDSGNRHGDGDTWEAREDLGDLWMYRPTRVRKGDGPA